MKSSNTFGRGCRRAVHLALVTATSVFLLHDQVNAAPPPGGTLDPLSIPKYVTPLVIPPVMKNTGTAGHYDIAAREFSQQILPAGFPATKVFGYGPASDPTPALAPDPGSQFNYPAYTVENTVGVPTYVKWRNDLVANPDACNTSTTPTTDPACHFVKSLIPIDRGLHWANPEQLTCTDPGKTKDCRPDLSNGSILAMPYDGPIPITTHVHGAHVNPESDGYPEAWWLPNANNIPVGYAMTGTLVNQYGVVTNSTPGIADFSYRNDQPSTTLWYHDHTLGMTRNNVYAGLAGFWLIRDSNGGENGLGTGNVLPGPAPKAGEPLALTKAARSKYREIPVLIQDRSFNADGSLFYPANRAFFEGLGDGQTPGIRGNKQAQLAIPTIGWTNRRGTRSIPSDILTIWNPEAFFNTMVVNGVTWPKLDVAQAEYRFRLLNGCNSRFLNLAMFVVNPDGSLGAEIPYYQIGADQSLMPKVIKVMTGTRTVLPGGTPEDAADPMTALLMGPAERADVIVDFSSLAAGTKVRVINTAPDAPYGGFPDIPADADSTGQIMEFVVDASLNGLSPTDPTGATPATKPENLALSLPDSTDPANSDLPMAKVEDQAILEEESQLICATLKPNGDIEWDDGSLPDPTNPGTCVKDNGRLANSIPMAPKAAVLGKNGSAGGVATLWSDPIATNPALGDSETWELWNWTEDAHPLHIHLVKFKVLNREAFDPDTGTLTGEKNAPELTEKGWKDTVVAYPGEVTRVNATFDIAGLYVWHCHILEHEDNEMMVPFCVGSKGANGCNAIP